MMAVAEVWYIVEGRARTLKAGFGECAKSDNGKREREQDGYGA